MNDQQTDGLPFDPDTFMQQNVDAPMETEKQLCPEGSHQAMIADFDSKAFEKFDFTYKRGPQAGSPGTMYKFNCPFSITDPKVLADMDRATVTVMQQIVIDQAPNGGLATGKDKNTALGQLREAVGQNTAGAWNFTQLKGAGPVLVQVRHEEYDRKDGTKGKAARVVRVTKHR